jgi:neuron navigator 2
VTNLGLSAESVFSYHIGEIMRTKDAELPELLPIGYLVGETMQIGICLKGRKDNFLQEIRWDINIMNSVTTIINILILIHK